MKTDKWIRELANECIFVIKQIRDAYIDKVKEEVKQKKRHDRFYKK